MIVSQVKKMMYDIYITFHRIILQFCERRSESNNNNIELAKYLKYHNMGGDPDRLAPHDDLK